MDTSELLGLPLFDGMSPEQAEALAVRLQPLNLQPNQHLFWVGDPGDDFFVIQQGRLTISFPDHSGREIILANLSKGDFVGEISLLDGGPRTATARAITETTLLRLGREDFLHFVHENPSVAIHMLKVLGRRQRDTVDRLRGIRNVNEVVREQSTRWQRVANTITTAASSQAFLLTHAVAFGGWIFFNLLSGSQAPDPFPFPFLCFWASTEGIFLALFILVSQSVQANKDRIRTEVEYQVALKMQLEIMQLHQKVDQLGPVSDPDGPPVPSASSMR